MSYWNNDCVTKKDIWEQLYKSRALEISTLWQRSVFLGAFVILLFTGYGVYCDRMFFSRCIDDCSHMQWVGIVFGLLIYLFGHLWIAMAQGSKRWAEIYEEKIAIIERMLVMNEQFWYKTERYINNMCDDKKVKDLLSRDEGKIWLKSDKMSPSKINIFIGGIILFLGAAIVLFHLVMILRQPSPLSCTVFSLLLAAFSVPILVAIVFVRKLFKHKFENKD